MADVTLIYGSVYGGAESLAQTLKSQIKVRGHTAEILAECHIAQLQSANTILVVTSTTGKGELPDNLMPLYSQLKAQLPSLATQRFAVIALGDSGYGDTFCGAGRKVDALLLELKAIKICPMLTIDACKEFDPEPAALNWLNGFLGAL